MSQAESKINEFLYAVDDAVVRAWNRANGVELGAVPPKDTDEPELTFAMLSSTDVSDDPATMVREIREALDAPAAPMPINLHLLPEMFWFGGVCGADKINAKVVRLENPTRFAVFREVEAYYRSLGCPDTDKRFVEDLCHPDATWPAEDMTVFMGS